jgi:hypothetical protein
VSEWKFLSPKFNISTHGLSPIYPIRKDKETVFNQFFTCGNNSLISQRKKLIIKEIEGNQFNNEQIIISHSQNYDAIILNNQIDSLSTNVASTRRTTTNKNVNAAIFKKASGVVFSITNTQKNRISHTINNDVYFYIDNSQLNTKDSLVNIQLFHIHYSKSNNNFILQPFVSSNNKIMSNVFFFLRINQSMKVKGFNLMLIGDVLLYLHSEMDKLTISIKDKNENGIGTKKQKVFKSSNSNSVFTIGRGNECDFVFPMNKSLSKIHCSFKYDKEDMCWVVFDGGVSKPSTNGIWYLPVENIPIISGLEFKILGCSRCQFIILNEDK